MYNLRVIVFLTYVLPTLRKEISRAADIKAEWVQRFCSLTQGSTLNTLDANANEILIYI